MSKLLNVTLINGYGISCERLLDFTTFNKIQLRKKIWYKVLNLWHSSSVSICKELIKLLNKTPKTN